MSEKDDNLNKLLRLKKYETPGQDYFDNFLDELKERQRRDAMKQSPLELMKERFVDWLDELGPKKWALPAGSLAALSLAFLSWGGKDRPLTETDPDTNTKIFEVQLPKVDKGPKAPTTGDSDTIMPAKYGNLLEL